MKATKQEPRLQDEPMGIVISRGSREEATPVFWAYAYEQPPEEETERRAPQAA